MKKFFMLICCNSVSVFCFSQTNQFSKGQVDINIGAGFITPLFTASEHTIKTTSAPITATIDFAVSDETSLGVYIASAKSDVYGNIYVLNTNTQYYGKQSTLRHLLIGGRLFYHFGLGARVDLYSGGMLAYNNVQETPAPGITLQGETEVKVLTYSLLLGGRLRFGKHVGIFLELGYGVTVINTGINFKF